jgi:hypothetical protein
MCLLSHDAWKKIHNDCVYGRHVIVDPVQLNDAGSLHCATTGQHSKGFTQGA